MSLLMDALRKAEEAKRLLANKDKNENKLGQVEALAPQDSAAPELAKAKRDEESVALNLTEQKADADEETSVDWSMGSIDDDPHDGASDQPNLDVPFDFQIDESFGVNALSESTQSVTASVDYPSATLTETPMSAPADALSLEDIADESSLELNPGFNHASPPNTEPAAIEAELSLSALELVERAEVPEPQVKVVANPPSLADNVASPAQNTKPTNLMIESLLASRKAPAASEMPRKVSSNLQTENAELPESPVQKESAIEKNMKQSGVKPIRALRDDEKVNAPISDSSEQAIKSPKMIEARKRQTARAVFNAKSNARSSASRTHKYVSLLAIVLVLLAGGGGYWFFAMSAGSGNQYNIPAAMLNNDQYQFPETAIENLESSALPDVTSETFQQQADTPILNSTVEVDSGQQSTPESVQISGIEPQITAQEVAQLGIERTVPLADPQNPLAQVGNASLSAVIPGSSPIVEDISTVSAEEANPLAVTSSVRSNAAAANADSSSVVGENSIPPAAVVEEQKSAPIRVLRSDTTPRINPQIVLAYSAYQQQNYLEARAHYQQVLLSQPTSRDAILGLAAIARKTGEPAQARTLYAKLLELDPRDALAQVGFMETMPASDPQDSEYTLKRLFAEHPDVAPLAFSLGNLYASQGRWNEAQQSYYDALLSAKANTSGSIDPDYAFNLAVSLERVNQLPAAYNFYREALALAQNAQHEFDIRVLRERLDAIERVLP